MAVPLTDDENDALYYLIIKKDGTFQPLAGYPTIICQKIIQAGELLKKLRNQPSDIIKFFEEIEGITITHSSTELAEVIFAIVFGEKQYSWGLYKYSGAEEFIRNLKVVKELVSTDKNIEALSVTYNIPLDNFHPWSNLTNTYVEGEVSTIAFLSDLAYNWIGTGMSRITYTVDGQVKTLRKLPAQEFMGEVKEVSELINYANSGYPEIASILNFELNPSGLRDAGEVARLFDITSQIGIFQSVFDAEKYFSTVGDWIKVPITASDNLSWIEKWIGYPLVLTSSLSENIDLEVLLRTAASFSEPQVTKDGKFATFSIFANEWGKIGDYMIPSYVLSISTETKEIVGVKRVIKLKDGKIITIPLEKSQAIEEISQPKERQEKPSQPKKEQAPPEGTSEEIILPQGEPSTIAPIEVPGLSQLLVVYDEQGNPQATIFLGGAVQYTERFHIRAYDKDFILVLKPIKDIAKELKENGHNTIKIYLPPNNPTPSDQKKLEKLIKTLYKKYEIRTYLTHYAGLGADAEGQFLLENPTPENLKKVKDLVREFAKWVKDLGPAAAGVQLGNEIDYFVKGAGAMYLGKPNWGGVNLPLEDFYPFMNEVGGIYKQIDGTHSLFLGLGQLDSKHISLLTGNLTNYDGIAINFFPNWEKGRPAEEVMSIEELESYFKEQVDIAEELGKPLVISEFGESSYGELGEQGQAEFARNAVQALSKFIVGSKSKYHHQIVGLFWHEYFPEYYKAAEIDASEPKLALFDPKDFKSKPAFDALSQGYQEIVKSFVARCEQKGITLEESLKRAKSKEQRAEDEGTEAQGKKDKGLRIKDKEGDGKEKKEKKKFYSMEEQMEEIEDLFKGERIPEGAELKPIKIYDSYGNELAIIRLNIEHPELLGYTKIIYDEKGKLFGFETSGLKGTEEDWSKVLERGEEFKSDGVLRVKGEIFGIKEVIRYNGKRVLILVMTHYDEQGRAIEHQVEIIEKDSHAIDSLIE
ncbi:MAG: hypothetical protein KKC11_08350, partial [Candidatus Omnitrophica bacterium]|nr:hypothetical protein [Candidatus Omnitrophota bacterium]